MTVERSILKWYLTYQAKNSLVLHNSSFLYSMHKISVDKQGADNGSFDVFLHPPEFFWQRFCEANCCPFRATEKKIQRFTDDTSNFENLLPNVYYTRHLVPLCNMFGFFLLIIFRVVFVHGASRVWSMNTSWVVFLTFKIGIYS